MAKKRDRDEERRELMKVMALALESADRMQGLTKEDAGEEFELVVGIRIKRPTKPHSWLHVRTIKDPAVLEQFYKDAGANVSMWDHDPFHIAHGEADIKNFNPRDIGVPGD